MSLARSLKKRKIKEAQHAQRVTVILNAFHFVHTCRKMLKPTDVFDTISEEEAVKEAQRAQRAAAARAAMQAANSSEDAKMASLSSSLNAEYGAKVCVHR